jgi:glycosyltransferase involved in cell wall biosynthesis
VLDGVTGVLIPPRNSTALAEAIQRFSQNRGLLTNMGQAGRQFACQKFDVKSIANKYLSLYDEVLEDA